MIIIHPVFKGPSCLTYFLFFFQREASRNRVILCLCHPRLMRLELLRDHLAYGQKLAMDVTTRAPLSTFKARFVQDASCSIRADARGFQFGHMCQKHFSNTIFFFPLKVQYYAHFQIFIHPSSKPTSRD